MWIGSGRLKAPSFKALAGYEKWLILVRALFEVQSITTRMTLENQDLRSRMRGRVSRCPRQKATVKRKEITRTMYCIQDPSVKQLSWVSEHSCCPSVMDVILSRRLVCTSRVESS